MLQVIAELRAELSPCVLPYLSLKGDLIACDWLYSYIEVPSLRVFDCQGSGFLFAPEDSKHSLLAVTTSLGKMHTNSIPVTNPFLSFSMPFFYPSASHSSPFTLHCYQLISLSLPFLIPFPLSSDLYVYHTP